MDGRWEVRWFVPGQLPDGARPPGAPRERRDQYDLSNLTPAMSVKRRGRRGRIEWKVRLGRVELVQIGALLGFAERWLKYRDDPPEEHRPGERWLAVHKQVWTDGRLEVAGLTVAGEHWWTLAIVDGHNAGAARLLAPWRELLDAAGAAGSYPSWLLEVVSRRPKSDIAA